jgi:hypothetical protein
LIAATAGFPVELDRAADAQRPFKLCVQHDATRLMR